MLQNNITNTTFISETAVLVENVLHLEIQIILQFSVND